MSSYYNAFGGSDGPPDRKRGNTTRCLRRMEAYEYKGESKMNATERKQNEALYLPAWDGGHKRGCPLAIPEMRTAMFVQCACDGLDESQTTPNRFGLILDELSPAREYERAQREVEE